MEKSEVLQELEAQIRRGSRELRVGKGDKTKKDRSRVEEGMEKTDNLTG